MGDYNYPITAVCHTINTANPSITVRTKYTTCANGLLLTRLTQYNLDTKQPITVYHILYLYNTLCDRPEWYIKSRVTLIIQG